jgi:hypothetical protein
MRGIAVFPLLLVAPPAAAQVVHYVDMLGACGGQMPCYRTILDAWNAASAADTIAVFPGLYPGVTLSGKSDISIQALDEEAKPVIAPPALTLQGVTNVRLADFVIAGAVTVYGGFNVTLERNRVTSIWFSIGGGATLQGNMVTGPIRIERPAGDFLIEQNIVQGGIVLGMAEEAVQRGIIRANLVLGGGISIIGENVRGNTIEANWIEDGLSMTGSGMGPLAFENTIHGNLVRGGGIALFAGSGIGGAVSSGRIDRNVVWASPVKGISLSARPGGGVVANQVEQNFVFGSGDDGIFVDNPGAANPNTFRQNTSIRNAGCDLNDVSATPNVWEQNRAGSACGHAAR